MDENADILCETRGAAGFVTLHRPRALNALNLGMVREMMRALESWEHDPGVTRVVVTGAGEKAFCAGGDIRHLTELGKAGRREEALEFWREEYRLNALIKRYGKPYVSLIDGIVMGGGVGVSLHGSHRVAGDRYLFAMPEVGIGFFPDVGATYALPRLPGATGMYIALTGERIRRADAVMLGLATHAVASGRIEELREALCDGAPVDEILGDRAIFSEAAPLTAHRDLIDSCFSGESVEAVLERLDRKAQEGSDFAAGLAGAIRTKSPTSLKIAFEQVRRGRALDFTDAMKTEFRIVSRIIGGQDFYEGVRATLIDKDGKPHWRPSSLDAVDKAAIDEYFANLGAGELEIS
ncbi:enoyl-CoA hydratase/isomerase family protein [Microvirga rosea]|uniref:enoyl-CoA hydratase/isomerase family protein n=1 Tax=Microvirga rosea TaxID=2715425 RepID=UPI001D0BE402|nr:enoyl-CoA hydratase/isomerase family protein [Microvirga rosea]MCB8820945.1 enoyl-CoA hydratase/isomerase family protein [Microvirga rosea]